MSTFADYARELHQFYETHSETLQLLPSQLLDRWDAFVTECEEGYSFDLSEYDNDIRFRSQVDVLLSASELASFPEYQDIVRRFGEIDRRFRDLFLPEAICPYTTSEWWRRGVLRYAGSAYTKDIKTRYGIMVADTEGASI